MEDMAQRIDQMDLTFVDGVFGVSSGFCLMLFQRVSASPMNAIIVSVMTVHNCFHAMFIT